MMTKNAFSYQFRANLLLNAGNLNFPNFVKELIKKGAVNNIQRFEDFFISELPNVSVQDDASADYFLFISKQALLHFFYRGDFEGFYQNYEIIRHRLNALKANHNLTVDLDEFQVVIQLLKEAFSRALKHVPIEQFEQHISDLDWASLEPESIDLISSILGYVYLKESDPEQSAKARLWITKSTQNGEHARNLTNYFFLVSYFLKHGNGDVLGHLRGISKKLEDASAEATDAAMRDLFNQAAFELEASLLDRDFANFDDNLTQLEYCQQRLRDLELDFANRKNYPAAVRSQIEASIAELYALLFSMTDDDLEQVGFSKRAIQRIDSAIELAESMNDDWRAMHFRLTRAELAVQTGMGITEKEVKETVQYFKKSQDYPAFVRTIEVYIGLLKRNENPQKSFDLMQEVFKLGNKRMEEGGFYLIHEGLRIANDVFLEETKEPGVSWMIHILYEFFGLITRAADGLEESMDLIGKTMIEQFRDQFLRFAPISHFNIKTYFLYQLYEIKMMRIGAILYKDKHSLSQANRLIKELEDPNNPLNFVQTAWTEFKDVPNMVRNNTLNKCINISKGDLPLAAEHLDFSYRNLRSYITFKEVNRLGFFLNEKLTNNWQLEQGIRYMFFDLYKKGTIFEVIFDMPKFLVEYAKAGFYSQDLERELNIKGTTAKKYIKIMIEIGLIRQDKTTGRKHYYRLIRENVMNRLGKEQATMIK